MGKVIGRFLVLTLALGSLWVAPAALAGQGAACAVDGRTYDNPDSSSALTNKGTRIDWGVTGLVPMTCTFEDGSEETTEIGIEMTSRTWIKNPKRCRVGRRLQVTLSPVNGRDLTLKGGGDSGTSCAYSKNEVAIEWIETVRSRDPHTQARFPIRITLDRSTYDVIQAEVGRMTGMNMQW